ncbi:MAG: rhodanese-like domain-containing protein [Planctomycetota bacterium]|jgi:rhodanese-related sulfurtransferase
MTIAENNRPTGTHNIRLLVAAIAFGGGLLPLVLYWLVWGQIEKITPPEAKELLQEENGEVVLVDVRPKGEYESAHIDGSRNWPAAGTFLIDSKEMIPGQFQDKTLLLICDGGIFSNIAAKHLTRVGVQKAISVSGGIQEWIGSASGPEGRAYEKYRSASGQISEFPTRISPLYEQVAAVASGFVIKPAYTILAGILAVLLWRRKAADLIALRWSMIFFFIGENFCATNYLVFTDKSHLLEYLHGYGMLLSFGFATYAILEGIDSRILMLSDPSKKCTALRLCKKCIKYEDVPCGLKRTFFMIIPASIMLAFMPLCADWHSNSYNTMIFGTFYNYTHRWIHQLFELVYCPIVSMLLLTMSLLALSLKKHYALFLAKIFFAAGIGPLGFGMFRGILAGLYSRNMVWFSFWEEGTELLFIVAVCFVLWIFRQSLFETANVER